ncbi:MAG: hypothetical protein HG467_003100 [Clostridiales bacterium]|nr:hypothetical protein [Clostridiales bacterium]
MPKEEMINRFDEKFAEVKFIATLAASAINKARTKEEKNIFYKKVKSLFDIIQNFNNLEKIEFYKWFLLPCEYDYKFEIINIKNIRADMQSALEEVAKYNLPIEDVNSSYSKILDKPINDLYFALDSQVNSLDYIDTDYEKEFFIEFLSLFIGCVECECICDNRSTCNHYKGTIIAILIVYLLIISLIGGLCWLVAQ